VLRALPPPGIESALRQQIVKYCIRIFWINSGGAIGVTIILLNFVNIMKDRCIYRIIEGPILRVEPNYGLFNNQLGLYI
jgi:hypothetical protein